MRNRCGRARRLIFLLLPFSSLTFSDSQRDVSPGGCYLGFVYLVLMPRPLAYFIAGSRTQTEMRPSCLWDRTFCQGISEDGVERFCLASCSLMSL